MAVPPSHLELVRDIFERRIPFNRELGLRVGELTEGEVTLVLPFRDVMIGDWARPAMHGGVISALIDTAGGCAVWSAVGPEDRVSTIDLRVDYLRPGKAEETHCRAQVLRLGNRVGVASMRLYHPTSPDETIADGRGVYAVKRAEDK